MHFQEIKWREWGGKEEDKEYQFMKFLSLFISFLQGTSKFFLQIKF